MSNIYIQEPPTEGKVLLETTVGDIDIELWSRECPKACRNFIQLCMEGYYDRTIFHRLVKEFIVQGGDPTGTGNGGNSVYGAPFKDEFHSRLRFMRRGLVGMANSGRDDNGSQFFFTLGPAQELQNKHTLFGKVGGNTIFNMIKLGDGDVDKNEKPLYPHKILKTKILHNPFDDIVPRESIKNLNKEGKNKNKSTAAATKNYSLLSFGEEAEEEEEQVDVLNKQFSGKGKSSHDLSHDPKLSKEPAVAVDKSEEASKGKAVKRKAEEEKEDLYDSSDSGEEEEAAEMDPGSASAKQPEEKSLDIGTLREKLKSKAPPKKETKAKKAKKQEGDFAGSSSDEEYYLGKADKLAEKERIKKIKEEYNVLKRRMKEERAALESEKNKKNSTVGEEEESELAKTNSVVKQYFEEQREYKERKKGAAKKGGDREALTMALLDKFKSKIAVIKESCPDADSSTPKVEKRPLYSGLLYEDGEGEDPSDMSWLAKSLHNEVEENVLAKDANLKSDDWYEMYDPKNPLNRRRRQETKRAEGERWKKSGVTD